MPRREKIEIKVYKNIIYHNTIYHIIMTTQILASDTRPMLFYGNSDAYDKFIGWIFYDKNGAELGTIEKIWYDPDECYRRNDGYYGNAYKMSVIKHDPNPTPATIELGFRYINSTLKDLNAFKLKKPPSPAMKTKIAELSKELSIMADRCYYLFDFDPNKILKSLPDFQESRTKLIEQEKKQYIHFYMNEDENIVIQLKKFMLMGDDIDEQESYWVDETVLVEIVVNLEETTVHRVIDLFLDECREAEV